MDQGLAAVLGAGVGVLGALGTAALTYVAARRQAIDNGKVHHWQKVRDERKETYLSFLGAMEEFQHEVSAFYAAFHPSSGLSVDETRRIAGDRLTVLYRECRRVELAGPDALVDLAVQFRKNATTLFGCLDDQVREGIEPNDASVRKHLNSRDDLIRLERKFIGAARDLLEAAPD